jgi:hypothetical protein
MMCLVCFQNLDCVRRHIQLIWILGVQEYVLFVGGNMLGVLEDCIHRSICLNQVGGVDERDVKGKSS